MAKKRRPTQISTTKALTESEKSKQEGQLAHNNDTSIVEEAVETVVDHKKGDKRSKFYLYWLLGLPIITSGKLAGYSESYSYSLVEQFKKKSHLRESVWQILNLIPDRYRALCKLRLAEISDIEARALDEYKKNPKLAIHKPKLLRDMKVSAGAIREELPSIPMVNIGSLQVLNHQMLAIARAKNEGEVVEPLQIANDEQSQ